MNSFTRYANPRKRIYLYVLIKWFRSIKAI